MTNNYVKVATFAKPLEGKLPTGSIVTREVFFFNDEDKLSTIRAITRAYSLLALYPLAQVSVWNPIPGVDVHAVSTGEI